jgi:hypothetical protein
LVGVVDGRLDTLEDGSGQTVMVDAVNRPQTLPKLAALPARGLNAIRAFQATDRLNYRHQVRVVGEQNRNVAMPKKDVLDDTEGQLHVDALLFRLA